MRGYAESIFESKFVVFALRETMSHFQQDNNGDPSFKTVESIIIEHDVTREGAWSLYRPIFWYLSDHNIIRIDNSRWYLHSKYHNTSEDTLKELAHDIVQCYKDTLNARFEKYCRV